APTDLERLDQLRARQRPREAVHGGVAEGCALPPAARSRQVAHQAEARVGHHRRGGALRGDREGLRDRARPVRGHRARRARVARPQGHPHDRHRGVRRHQPDRPDVLRAAVLPRAGRAGGQAVPAAGGGAGRVEQGGHRPLRDADKAVPRGGAGHGRPPAAVDDALRGRGRAGRAARWPARQGRGDHRPRAEDGSGAHRLPGRGPVRAREVPRRVPRAGARPHREEGGRRGHHRSRSGGRTHQGGRPAGRTRGERGGRQGSEEVGLEAEEGRQGQL
ncbi:MAG: Ku-like_protein, partial [uncultured Acidimicrobiales bacterium]